MSIPYKIEIEDGEIMEFIKSKKSWRGHFPHGTELRWKAITLTGEEFEMLMVNGVEIRLISRESITNL